MTSALIDKWLPHRQTNEARTDTCVCGTHSCVCTRVIHRRVRQWKKIAHGAKRNRISIDNRTPTVVTLHRFHCLTPKTYFIMPILVRKAKMRLTYREEKPEVHVVRRLTYPKVTGKQLVQYAANAAAIPPSRCPRYRSRSRHGNSWHECRTTSSSRRSPRWESNLSKTKNIPPKAVIFSDFCCTFAMSWMILLVLICSTKVSEKSDMAKSWATRLCRFARRITFCCSGTYKSY